LENFMFYESFDPSLRSFGWRYVSFALKGMQKLQKLELTLEFEPHMDILLPLLRQADNLTTLTISWSSARYDENICNSDQDCLKSLLNLTAPGSLSEMTGLIKQCRKLQSLTWWRFEQRQEYTIREMFLPLQYTLRSLALYSPVDYFNPASEGEGPRLRQLKVCEFPVLEKLSLLNWFTHEDDQPKDLYDAFFLGRFVNCRGKQNLLWILK